MDWLRDKEEKKEKLDYSSAMFSHSHVMPACSPSPVVAIVGCTLYLRLLCLQLSSKSSAVVSCSTVIAFGRSRLLKKSSRHESYEL